MKEPFRELIELVNPQMDELVPVVSPMKPPKILDKMVDVIFAYRPESKVKPPKERKKSTKRLSDAESVTRLAGMEEWMRIWVIEESPNPGVWRVLQSRGLYKSKNRCMGAAAELTRWHIENLPHGNPSYGFRYRAQEYARAA